MGRSRAQFATATVGELALSGGAPPSKFLATDGLRFQFAQHRPRQWMGAFASITLRAHGYTPNPVLLLAGLDASVESQKRKKELQADSASDDGGGSVTESESGASSGEDAMDDETLDEETLELMRSTGCGFCGRDMAPAGGAPPQSIVVCSGCKQCFHRRCCHRHGMHTHMYFLSNADWFHSPQCAAAHRTCLSAVKRGETLLNDSGTDTAAVAVAHTAADPAGVHDGAAALAEDAEDLLGSGDAADYEGTSVAKGPRTWQLLARERSGADKQEAWDAVVDILMDDYGQFIGDRIMDCEYAALVRSGGYPVCAALVDVFGADLLTIDAVATRKALRRQGHCRAVLAGAQQLLHELGGGQLLVIVPGEDATSQGLWQNSFGMRPLSKGEAARLRRRYAPLALYPGAVFLEQRVVAHDAGAQDSKAKSLWQTMLTPLLWPAKALTGA